MASFWWFGYAHSYASDSVRYVPSWFPGASWKRLAAEWAEDLRRSKDNPINVVKKDLVSSISNYITIIRLHQIDLIKSTGEGYTEGISGAYPLGLSDHGHRSRGTNKMGLQLNVPWGCRYGTDVLANLTRRLIADKMNPTKDRLLNPNVSTCHDLASQRTKERPRRD